jgi:glycosyltransferase involved in cell wall biosynthesis
MEIENLAKNLNIGFDAKRYFQNRTGLGNYSHHIIDGLAQLFPSLKLTLFTPRAEQSNHKVVFPNKSNFLAKFWRISGLIKEESFQKLDIYHGLSNELPWRKTKVKTVVTVHDIIFKHLPQTQHPINRWIYDFKTKRACRLASKIIATSDFTKKDLIDFYKIEPEKIAVVYQDCHPQFYNYTFDSSVLAKYKIDFPYILCVGTIEERKHQLLLIQSFKDLDCEERLVFIGQKTKYFKEIETYLELNPNLKNKLVFLENVSFAELPSLYEKAKIFVYPSEIEGFGIPVLEAMNTGTPIITTKNTVMEEVCADAALYFEKNNLSSLQNSIHKLLEDRELAKDLTVKGKTRALFFRKEINIPKLVAIYQKL